MTSKQRAYLRKLSNPLDTIAQIGKEGLTESVLQQLDQSIEKRELIKVRVLETAGLTAREACQSICARLECEPVQCIGTRFVLYRPSKKDPQIVLPKEK